MQVSNNGVNGPAASVNVTYTSPETAGNLNVVVVGWNDTSASVTSVVDDNNNTYVLAGTSAGGSQSQAIYYAANIALPTNNTPTVTVTFNQAANVPDIRILEYSGISATNPLDGWSGNWGHSVFADSNAVVTSASDMLVAAGTTSTHFTAAGAGFTSRGITSPFGDIVEDSNAAQPAGTYNGTAALNNGDWVMQVAAFSPTPVTFTNAPVIDAITPITPATGGNPGGTYVTILGTNFQPGAVVLFGTAPGGLSGVNCFESGGTTITCLTPANSVGVKDITVVNVDGQHGSSIGAYTYVQVTPPTISTITPVSGPTNGSAVTITGTGFQAGAIVEFGGLPSGNVVVQNSTTITANTPGLPVGLADVTVKNLDAGSATSVDAFTYTMGTGPINYVQRGDAVAGVATTTIQASMSSLQTAGNLNVVIIGWADATASVSSVTDSEGNTYVAALPATSGTGLRQDIYYAKNIAGDPVTPNVVTVTFNQGAQFPDIRVLEYSGLDTGNPLDDSAGDTGTGTLADSGSCTTTNAVELIVAGGTVGTHITGPGTGFTLVDLTRPNGSDAQHQITSAAGSCQATAPLSASSEWVMQTVSFKLPPPNFSVSATPTSQTVVQGSPATYTITVTGSNGFSSAVTLGCDSLTLPTGATCGFVPNPVTPGGSPATSTLTISTTAGTPAATSSVTVTATAGSLSHTTPVGLTVTPLADFTIAASTPSPAAIAQGGSATSTITIAALNGFSGAVSLSCSNITPVVTPPPTCAFVPSPVPGGSGSSTLTISTQVTTPVGTFSVTVTGTSGLISHNASVSLTVNAPGDFSLTTSPLSPAAGAAGTTATSTITISPLNGFNSAVNLTCSIAPAVTRGPTCSFNPSSVPGGSGASTLTVSTTAATTSSLSRSSGIFYAMWLPIGALALLGKGSCSRRKKFQAGLLVLLMLSGLIFLAACGGSNSSSGGNGGHPGTPAGTYTVTITATSSTLIHTTTAALTVQ